MRRWVALVCVVLAASPAFGATTLYLRSTSSEVATYKTLSTSGPGSSTTDGYVDVEAGVPSAGIQFRTGINGGGDPLQWLSCPLSAVDFGGGASKAFAVVAFDEVLHVEPIQHAHVHDVRQRRADRIWRIVRRPGAFRPPQQL